jgi:hypothetical protein
MTKRQIAFLVVGTLLFGSVGLYAAIYAIDHYAFIDDLADVAHPK